MDSHDAQTPIRMLMAEERMVHLAQNLRMLIAHIHSVVLLHTQPKKKKVFGNKQILYKTAMAQI